MCTSPPKFPHFVCKLPNMASVARITSQSLRAARVVVAGATGAVGQDMLHVLERRNFPVSDIKLLASARSVGKTMTFRGKQVAVQELKDDRLVAMWVQEVMVMSTFGISVLNLLPSLTHHSSSCHQQL